ncbi:MAG: methylated-DNA--[protein]-cysteine S-methyltransferase [Hymenobacteraceae bacterium]|nr:methylated-DNA--[protein]-cysteine S-methyltransferase [Hymenobacteraceae bacterium]MDX5395066.1 methylated-DNA--[protein]-cysteine S-methyltransferase [Hymenobacteraceae bacterium]MDX5443174.1 methylated-DNA--[protein]-cysteine S-methyltransferase [Hymenobacteraceae bacterium]MDX5511102.1 methylated-DNA--[protein]-cysteine S-methyltransferase [Hymenobacteraceae bacterium]
MENLATAHFRSPIGVLEITGTKAGIRSVIFIDSAIAEQAAPPAELKTCFTQLEEYFNGQREHFSVPLDISGTQFQQQVWRAVRQIPFGSTRSYGTIAKSLQNQGAVRAVGSANAHNPLALLVPCHRVTGTDGQLTGYAWGLWRKQWLLQHEQKQLPQAQLSLF